MGSPLVRRDELDKELAKQNNKMNRIKREVRSEVIEYLESLGLTGPATEDDSEAPAGAVLVVAGEPDETVELPAGDLPGALPEYVEGSGEQEAEAFIEPEGAAAAALFPEES
jgi:hypothetical protein